MKSNKTILYPILLILITVLLITFVPDAPHSDGSTEPTFAVTSYFSSVEYDHSTAQNNGHEPHHITSNIILYTYDKSTHTKYFSSYPVGGVWNGDLPAEGTLVNVISTTGHIKDVLFMDHETRNVYRYQEPTGKYYLVIVSDTNSNIVCADRYVLVSSKQELKLKSACYETYQKEIETKKLKLYFEHVQP